jgi:hypothetical protein
MLLTRASKNVYRQHRSKPDLIPLDRERPLRADFVDLVGLDREVVS